MVDLLTIVAGLIIAYATHHTGLAGFLWGMAKFVLAIILLIVLAFVGLIIYLVWRG